MALIPSSRYPAQTDTGDVGYPHGRARNAGSYQDGTGTPLERDWLNDLWGFQQSLLAAAGVTPSGDPDEVGASDYLLSVQLLLAASSAASSEGVVLANWVNAGTLSGTSFKLHYVPSQFVATGASGAILTSPDGLAWTTRTSDVSALMRSVVASPDGGAVVAVGYTGAITRSTDGGVTWAEQTSGTGEDLEAVTSFNGTFVAVGENGAVLTSSDGITWTVQTSGLTTEDLRGVALDGAHGLGTKLVAVGQTGTVITSPDGVTWTSRTSGTTDLLTSVAWMKGTFVAVGTNGTIITSPDGVTWTARTSGTTEVLQTVISTEHHFIAVGFNGTLLASSTGSSWAAIENPTPSFPGVGLAWNGHVCIACNSSSDLIRSLHRL